MKTVTLQADCDGEHTVLADADERDSWYLLSAVGLEAAYGDDEPEYTLDLVIEPNPDYEGE